MVCIPAAVRHGVHSSLRENDSTTMVMGTKRLSVVLAQFSGTVWNLDVAPGRGWKLAGSVSR